MLIPARGKVLVSVLKLTHPELYLPDSYKPDLSVAMIVEGNGSFETNSKVLIPTKAGLDINEGGARYRLINESDVVAKVGD